jgi:hypothetical protein
VAVADRVTPAAARRAIERRWRLGGVFSNRSIDFYTEAGCRVLLAHAFGDVNVLLDQVAALELTNRTLGFELALTRPMPRRAL